MARTSPTTNPDDEHRQAQILRRIEREHFTAFMNETPAKATDRPAENAARKPARTPGSTVAVVVSPRALGLGVIEVPAGPHAVRAACNGLGIEESAVAGTSTAEHELLQVWVRNTGSGPNPTAERCCGWISSEAWIPIESPESLARMTERAATCEAVNLLAAADRLDRTSPEERAMQQLEAGTSTGVLPASREQLETLARAATAARRAAKRMRARMQRHQVVRLGQGARPRR